MGEGRSAEVVDADEAGHGALVELVHEELGDHEGELELVGHGVLARVHLGACHDHDLAPVLVEPVEGDVDSERADGGSIVNQKYIQYSKLSS